MTTFTVNNTNDSGLGSLRQAIADANAAIGLDTIEFDNNLSGQEIILTSGELQITDDLTINGLGSDFLTISGNNADRVFLVDDENGSNQINVTFDGLTIIEGTNDDGAAIANSENLTVINSDISNNVGAVISSEFGNLTVINSDISDNIGVGITFAASSVAVSNSRISNNADWGIEGYDGSWEITNSTISANGSGGINLGTTSLIMTGSVIANNTGTGIRGSRVNLEIDNSLISGNTTTGDGGGIAGGSVAFDGTITNSQIINNIADSDGDGNGDGGGFKLYIGGGSVEFTNTIIAGNFDNSPAGYEQHPDLSGPGFSSGGNNFVGDITGVRDLNPQISYNPFTAQGDLFGTSENPLDLAEFIEGNGLRIEAEDYVNYSDTTDGNTGGAYRNDDVDLEVTTDIGGGFNVGYIEEGEWLTYNVDIPEPGLYQVVARVASNTTDGRVHNLDISLDGESTSLGFDATGGWQSWTDVIGDNFSLSAGNYELRLDMGSCGFNINYIDLIPIV